MGSNQWCLGRCGGAPHVRRGVQGQIWRIAGAAHHFCVLIFGVRVMRSIQYRKIAAECLDRARHAYKSEDVDAWLLIAEDWLRLAIESEAANGQPRGSSQR